MWRINHQRCGLIFGPAAAILQIAHPRIAQGVADHSNFKTDTLGRLNRTLAATNRIAFGTKSEARAVKDHLRRVHGGIKGEISPGIEGKPKYSAFEPDLLLWVLATLIMAARQGYEMVEGPLDADREEAFYRDMREFGGFFGLDEHYGPQNSSEFNRYYQSMLEDDILASHPLCSELAHAIACPGDSPGTTLLGNSIRFMTIEALPSPVRERLGFQSVALTRGPMFCLRKALPVTFKWLPKKVRMFPEAIERIQRDASSKFVKESS